MLFQEIPLSSVFRKIEAQKNETLNRPILVFSSDAARDPIERLTNVFRESCHNPNLFQFHSPTDAPKVLAESVPRTLVFFFYRSDSFYQKAWFQDAIAPRFAEYSVVDSFLVNTTRLDPTEMKSLSTLGATRIPCVLVFRAGHCAETIFPEVEGTLVADQVAEYRRCKMSTVKPAVPQDLSKEGLKGDDDRQAFEDRLRQKELEEKRKEAQAAREHRLAVKRRIEENKARRAGR